MQMSTTEEVGTKTSTTKPQPPPSKKDVAKPKISAVKPKINIEEMNKPIVKVKKVIEEDVSKILSTEIEKNVTSTSITGAALSVASIALISDASITTAVMTGLAAAYVSLKPGMSGSVLRSIGKVAWDGMEMAAKVYQETNMDKVAGNVTKALLEKTLNSSSAAAKTKALVVEEVEAVSAEEEELKEDDVVEVEKDEIVAYEKVEAEMIEVDQEAVAKIAAEKAEADRIAAERAEADRIAAERAEADRIAAEKAEADRIAAERAEADRIAAEEAEAERIAAEKAQFLKLEYEKAKTETTTAKKANVAETMISEKVDTKIPETNQVKGTSNKLWFAQTNSPQTETKITDMEKQAAKDAEATGITLDKNQQKTEAMGKKNSMKANYESLGFDNRFA